MSAWRVQIRKSQTIEEIDRVNTAFQKWLDLRLGADKKKQYQTQLKALGSLVASILKSIRQETQANCPEQAGEAYQFCLQQEKRVLWVERTLWGFYRQKFDQRDQEELAQVLEAADDVVWSCYKEACDNAGITELPPVPLAYIEPNFTPQALPRDEPPLDWSGERTGDSLLGEYFSRLPIPVVSLPPVTTAEPWWLIYLGHETGHHIQYDLDLITLFGKDLKDTAAGQPGETAFSAQRWADWSKEVFADLYSVYMMGAGAVWAITELVRSRPADLLLRQGAYPPPAARLSLLAKMADSLNLKGSAALGEIQPEQAGQWILDADYQEEWRKEALSDIGLVEAILKAGKESKLSGRGPLSNLAGWSEAAMSPGSFMTKCLAAFRNYGLPFQEPSQQAARWVTAAAMERWRDLANSELKPGAPVPDLGQEKKTLKKLYIQALEANRDEATRAEVPTQEQNMEILSSELSGKLLQIKFPEVA
jgi:hypothetical protein